MAVKLPNPGLFYSDFGRSLGLSGLDQFLSHFLDRPSQACSLIGPKKVQIAQLSPSSNG